MLKKIMNIEEIVLSSFLDCNAITLKIFNEKIPEQTSWVKLKLMLLSGKEKIQEEINFWNQENGIYKISEHMRHSKIGTNRKVHDRKPENFQTI